MPVTTDLVSAQEAAQMLTVDRSRILVLLRQGRFEGAMKIGSYWAIPREAVENFQRLKPGVKSKTKQQRDDDIAMLAGIRERLKGSTSDGEQ